MLCYLGFQQNAVGVVPARTHANGVIELFSFNTSFIPKDFSQSSLCSGRNQQTVDAHEHSSGFLLIIKGSQH